jgi:hypothetical protein
MPQGPIPVTVVLNPKAKTQLNITTQTVLKAAPGTLLSVIVMVAGSATGTVNDCATTAAVAAANQVATVPTSVGPVQGIPSVGFPMGTGIVVTPGTGQTLAVAWQ